MDGNTLTGLRNHGAAFGGFTIVDCSFSNNGEDGLRSVSIEDKSDPYDRRVGGMDLDLYSVNTAYNNNGKDGVKLGQGISAAFGAGTVATGNTFDNNGRNGVMITQHNSPYLDNLYAQGNQRRRIVQVNFASMSGNGRNGIDIGMDALQEGGNLQQADEVATDIGHARILRGIGEHDPHARRAAQRDELGRLEALVPDLHRMAQLHPVLCRRQQLKERAEILRVELLRRHELPEDRPQLVPQLNEIGRAHV